MLFLLYVGHDIENVRTQNSATHYICISTPYWSVLILNVCPARRMGGGQL